MQGIPVLVPHQFAKCQHPFPCFDPATGRNIRRVCGRWRCSVECRRVWKRRFQSVLISTLNRHPVTHVIRVSCHNPIDDRVLSKAHSDLLRRLRRTTDCDYWAINEWSGGKRHLHALTRAKGDVPSGLIGELWNRALPGRKLTYYADRVRDQVAIAMYLSKFEEAPPDAFSGRLFSSSREFFPKSVTELMKEKTRSTSRH